MNTTKKNKKVYPLIIAAVVVLVSIAGALGYARYSFVSVCGIETAPLGTDWRKANHDAAMQVRAMCDNPLFGDICNKAGMNDLDPATRGSLLRRSAAEFGVSECKAADFFDETGRLLEKSWAEDE